MNVGSIIEQQLNTEFPSLLQTSTFSSLYEVDENNILGRGRYAVVKRCINRGSKEVFAGKFMKKRRKAEIIKELKVLQFSGLHPNIISLFEVHEVGPDIAFLLEHAAGGDLQSLLERFDHLNEHDSSCITYGLIQALGFLHSLNIIHLDIKPQNILMLHPWPDLTVRLCDFGLAKCLNDGSMQEIAGTPDYIAPEVIAFETLTTACDMWSAGVVAYVLLCGHCPFLGDTDQEVFANITRADFNFEFAPFDVVSKSALDFIQHLMVIKPRDRLNATQALSHEWLSSCSNKSFIGTSEDLCTDDNS